MIILVTRFIDRKKCRSNAIYLKEITQWASECLPIYAGSPVLIKQATRFPTDSMCKMGLLVLACPEILSQQGRLMQGDCSIEWGSDIVSYFCAVYQWAVVKFPITFSRSRRVINSDCCLLQMPNLVLSSTKDCSPRNAVQEHQKSPRG